MTDFENETLQKLLHMKAAELKNEGQENFAQETENLSIKLSAYKYFGKKSDK